MLDMIATSCAASGQRPASAAAPRRRGVGCAPDGRQDRHDGRITPRTWFDRLHARIITASGSAMTCSGASEQRRRRPIVAPRGRVHARRVPAAALARRWARPDDLVTREFDGRTDSSRRRFARRSAALEWFYPRPSVAGLSGASPFGCGSHPRSCFVSELAGSSP